MDSCECIHGLDASWCAICRHPGDFITPPRKRRRVSLAKTAAKQRKTVAVAEQYLSRQRCWQCDGWRDHRGRCPCERVRELIMQRDEILAWAMRSGRYHGISEHGEDAAWTAFMGLHRAMLEAGRDMVVDGITLRDVVMGEAAEIFQLAEKWKPRRNHRASDTPL